MLSANFVETLRRSYTSFVIHSILSFVRGNGRESWCTDNPKHILLFSSKQKKNKTVIYLLHAYPNIHEYARQIDCCIEKFIYYP